MARHKLNRTGKRPLAFEGELLGEWRSSMESASPRYSGRPGRWEELRVYETASGRIVIWIARRTVWQGEHDIEDAVVFDRAEDAVAWVEEHAPRWAGDVAELLEVSEEV